MLVATEVQQIALAKLPENNGGEAETAPAAPNCNCYRYSHQQYIHTGAAADQRRSWRPLIRNTRLELNFWCNQL
jgi:hypothetical protein